MSQMMIPLGFELAFIAWDRLPRRVALAQGTWNYMASADLQRPSAAFCNTVETTVHEEDAERWDGLS